jgi:hypothetical protein
MVAFGVNCCVSGETILNSGLLSVLLLVALLSPGIAAQGAVGTICLTPIPLPAKQPHNIYGGVIPFNPTTLSVRIDKGTLVPWPHKDSVKISNLDTTEHHLVAIISDGKVVQSFRFRFSDFGSSDLCLSFDGFPPALRDAKHAPWCKCK